MRLNLANPVINYSILNQMPHPLNEIWHQIKSLGNAGLGGTGLNTDRYNMSELAHGLPKE